MEALSPRLLGLCIDLMSRLSADSYVYTVMAPPTISFSSPLLLHPEVTFCRPSPYRLARLPSSLVPPWLLHSLPEALRC